MLLPVVGQQLRQRGPATAVAMFLAVASFAASSFFSSLRNTLTDCPAHSGAAKGLCIVDVIETVYTGLLTVGSSLGAAVIGFGTPTPRDAMVFHLDGVAVEPSHLYGLSRTEENPAIIHWQHNATARVQKYITYSKDGALYHRHATGVQVPDPDAPFSLFRKRASCEAYIDTVIQKDNLNNNEYAHPLAASQVYGAANNLFNWLVNNKKNIGCVAFKPNVEPPSVEWGATFQIGGACAQKLPYPENCFNTNYNVEIYDLTGA